MTQLVLDLIRENKITRDPFLDLGNCGLRSALPSELADCDWLEELNLGTSIFDYDLLRHVRSPNKGQENWFDQPDLSILSALKSLRKLHLVDAMMADLHFLSAIPNLFVLNLAHNMLTDISPLQHLPHLLYLNLSHNSLTHLEPLRNMKQMVRLSIDYNNITSIAPLEKMQAMSYLEMGKNKIDSLAPIRQAKKLKILHFDINKVTDLRPLKDLARLVSLNALSNPVVRPDGLEPLAGLQYVSVFADDTKALRNKPALRNLTLHYAGAISLEFLGCCRQLTDLTLMGFYQPAMPDLAPLASLAQLERLQLLNTCVSDLRPLYGLSRLTHLDLTLNAIKVFPPDLLPVLPSLKELTVTHNPITNIPQQILKAHNVLPAMQHYLAEKAKGAVPSYEAKLIVVGNGAVGKTSLLRRWLDNGFNPHERSTHGIRCRLRQYPELARLHQLGHLRLNIWDFGGQDIYHATHRFFMRTQALFLLVWDHGTEQMPQQTETLPDGQVLSFRNHSLLYWLSYIKKLSDDCPVLLVQTKRARDGRRAPPLTPAVLAEYNVRQVLAVESGTALVNGFPALEEAVQEVLVELINTQCTQLPQAWALVRQQLGALQAGTRLLPLARFMELCRQAGMDEPGAALLLDYLHNAGIVFHRRGLLQDQLILDQQWIIGAIYLLFERGGLLALGQPQGYVTGEQLLQVWAGYSAAEQELFVTFLVQCEIGIETTSAIGGQDFAARRFIIPQLLPEQKPATLPFVFDEGKGLYFKYRYPFLPYTVIQEFIYRVGHLAELKEMWKGGILLKQPGATALVEAFPENFTILLRLREAAPSALLEKIRWHLQQINFRQVVEEFISLDGRQFVPVSQLGEAGAKNRTVQSENGEWLPLAPFLPFVQAAEEEDGGRGRSGRKQRALGDSLKDVFICHASEDKAAIVEPLVRALTAKGISVWYDKQRIGWGDSITQMVDEGLRNSSFVIVIVSRHFLKKSWPRKEMYSALHWEISFGDKKVLPILVGNRLERIRLQRQLPLQIDKLFLVWNNSPEEVVEALQRML